MIARLISIALGIWLMVAPAALSYSKPLAASDRIVGPIVATASIIAIWEVTRSLRWISLMTAPWLLFSPLVLGAPTLAHIAHHVLVALILAGLAFAGGETKGRYGGGWSVLWNHNGDSNS